MYVHMCVCVCTSTYVHLHIYYYPMWHILTNRVVQAMLHYSRLEQPTPTSSHVLKYCSTGYFASYNLVKYK